VEEPLPNGVVIMDPADGSSGLWKSPLAHVISDRSTPAFTYAKRNTRRDSKNTPYDFSKDLF
jgi:hypothetical protein